MRQASLRELLLEHADEIAFELQHVASTATGLRVSSPRATECGGKPTQCSSAAAPADGHISRDAWRRVVRNLARSPAGQAWSYGNLVKRGEGSVKRSASQREAEDMKATEVMDTIFDQLACGRGWVEPTAVTDLGATLRASQRSPRSLAEQQEATQRVCEMQANLVRSHRLSAQVFTRSTNLAALHETSVARWFGLDTRVACISVSLQQQLVSWWASWLVGLIADPVMHVGGGFNIYDWSQAAWVRAKLWRLLEADWQLRENWQDLSRVPRTMPSPKPTEPISAPRAGPISADGGKDQGDHCRDAESAARQSRSLQHRSPSPAAARPPPPAPVPSSPTRLQGP